MEARSHVKFTIPLLSPDNKMLEDISNCNDVIGLLVDVLSSFCTIIKVTNILIGMQMHNYECSKVIVI
jgi:hypothetical protein